uniref:Putative secreted protein n=1 Tax=Anopheles marajoara TaxID=58244 RepID=A0A2M4C9X1_9DIPT
MRITSFFSFLPAITAYAALAIVRTFSRSECFTPSAANSFRARVFVRPSGSTPIGHWVPSGRRFMPDTASESVPSPPPTMSASGSVASSST